MPIQSANINRNQRELSRDEAFRINGKVPSQLVEIEESVLGAMIIDNDALVNNIDRIMPEYFYKQENKEIFEAIVALNSEGNDVDFLTLTNKLKQRGTFDAVGGSAKLAALTENIASAAHIETYIRMLAEKYLQGELIRISTQTLTEAYAPTTDPLELLDKVSTKILQVNDLNINQAEKPLSMLSLQTLQEVENSMNSDALATGLPSGYPDLDNITGGFQPGALIILAARPAMGKTAFALNIARNMAVDFKKNIAVFSLEMTATELMMRLIASESGIEAQKLKRANQLTNQELERVKEAAHKLSDVKMYIDDNPGLNIMELKAKCKRMKKSYGIDMIFIDYLQLMSGTDSRNTNREQEISYISRQLKSLAKEMNMPVFALSQLSRAVEQRGGRKEPMLSDLRESGAIEQDADIVMFIYRPAYYQELEDENGSTEGIAYINVAKNRSGKVDKARLGFEDRFVRFSNLSNITSNIGANMVFDDTTEIKPIQSKQNNISDNVLPDDNAAPF